MTKGTKIAAGVTKILFGLLGVDYFVVGRVGKGVSEIISTIITAVLYIPVAFVSIIPVIGQIIGGLLAAVLSISILVRQIINIVVGIIILASPVEVARVKYRR